jgi:hypothetical protein
VDNQQMESMFPDMQPEQVKTLAVFRQMMELQGKGRQLEMMAEMLKHLIAARDIMDEMQAGYDY